MRLVFTLLQLGLIMGIAPLISGVITKIKNNIRMRKGAGVLQPYYDLLKLFSKGETVSRQTSWIFSVTPYVVFSSSIVASFLIPVFRAYSAFSIMGDVVALIFVLALGRFFLALAGLDTGSSFGGMGSSREMFISSFAESAAILALFAIALNVGTTNVNVLSSASTVKLSTIFATLALFLVILAETSRIPIDNQETHLELTMIHEAMMLEYSGRSLALLEFASYMKQAIFFSLIVNFLFPCALYAGTFGAFISLGLFLVKIFFMCVIVAIIEISFAKMRLFRAVDFISFAATSALISLVVSGLGV